MALTLERQRRSGIPTFFVGGRHSRLAAYLVAVGLTITALGVRLMLGDLFGANPTLLIFTVPIILSAYLGGMGPGFLATALSLFAATYYVLPRLGSLAISDVASIWQQAIILVTGALISTICELLHRAHSRAVRVIDQLRRSEENLQAVTDNFHEGILLANRKGQILHWNPAGLKMFGFANLDEGLHHRPHFNSVFKLTALDGGRIWADAQVDKGATFAFTLHAV